MVSVVHLEILWRYESEDFTVIHIENSSWKLRNLFSTGWSQQPFLEQWRYLGRGSGRRISGSFKVTCGNSLPGRSGNIIYIYFF